MRLNQVRVSRHHRCVAIMMYMRYRILCGGAALGTAISGQHHSSAGADSHRSGEAVPDAMDCGDARGYAARERCTTVGFALLLLRFRVAECTAVVIRFAICNGHHGYGAGIFHENKLLYQPLILEMCGFQLRACFRSRPPGP